ncbi:MAG: toll/interleukin-1 receptor domain-containing protein, partial [Anaerolineae bacterium]|nr:toll/interleukin-1 receptor domain-containing protein [Anaerolineae bacterium]
MASLLMFIFISYRKTDRARVEQLSADLSEMGHEVWFDKELTGGHEWWASILNAIRQCDLFIFALTQDALESEACQQEYRYAASLHKRILPIKLADIASNLLPPELAKIQWVDYQRRGTGAVLRLSRAMLNLPPAQPM